MKERRDNRRHGLAAPAVVIMLLGLPLAAYAGSPAHAEPIGASTHMNASAGAGHVVQVGGCYDYDRDCGDGYRRRYWRGDYERSYYERRYYGWERYYRRDCGDYDCGYRSRYYGRGDCERPYYGAGYGRCGRYSDW